MNANKAHSKYEVVVVQASPSAPCRVYVTLPDLAQVCVKATRYAAMLADVACSLRF